MAGRKNRRFKRAAVRTRPIPTQPVRILNVPPIKLDPLWGSKRMAVLDGRQVRCLTFDEGSVWIHGLDELPLLVRRRLADARHNICPTCVDIETRNSGAPTLNLYFAVIEGIERMLDRAERRFNGSI
jgi:hypothetical protein